MAGPFVGAQEHVVGDHVQFLLILALHVLGAGGAEHPDQRAVVDQIGNHLAGSDDVIEQGGEITGGVLDVTLFLDDELGDRDATVVHGETSILLLLATGPCPKGREVYQQTLIDAKMEEKSRIYAELQR